MSYPCHYTHLCPHKPHKHAHTHKIQNISVSLRLGALFASKQPPGNYSKYPSDHIVMHENSEYLSNIVATAHNPNDHDGDFVHENVTYKLTLKKP